MSKVVLISAAVIVTSISSVDVKASFGERTGHNDPSNSAQQKLDVAMGGYDPVSYFQEGLPKAGKPEIHYVYLGRYYYFSSEENKAKFVESPVGYSPLYAGHCAHSFSQDIERVGNPGIFNIDTSGNLVLFANEDAKSKWLQSPNVAKQKADKRWEARKSDITKYKTKF